jgi:hypothetical protein
MADHSGEILGIDQGGTGQAAKRYAHLHKNSAECEQKLELDPHEDNFHRPHASLNLKTTASGVALNSNNLLNLRSWRHLSVLSFMAFN